MQTIKDTQDWKQYIEHELGETIPLLRELGFVLDDVQVHISGERYLMSGKKLVLVGTRITDGKRVVIKASSEQSGRQEIAHEVQTRNALSTLNFSYHHIVVPTPVLHHSTGTRDISVTEYIEQEKAFLERPLTEQFKLTLKALKVQEGVHATTYSHAKIIRNTFGIWGATEYIDSFAHYKKEATTADPKNHSLAVVLEHAEMFLQTNKDTIEQYSGFLTHTDFVPHNLRVAGDDIYLLDHTSLRFGNKYESWARFLNFMLLYNRPLEQALSQYVRQNRTQEEYLSLRLMRIYKIGFLLAFYTSNLAKTTGDLHELTNKRITFWIQALESILKDIELPDTAITAYQSARDALRSNEEKRRQQQLH